VRVFENRVLSRIFRLTRDEVRESEEDYITRSSMLCTPQQTSLGDRVTKNEMGRTCSAYEEKESAYRGLVGKPEDRRPFERPRRR
jgi:hypothetical protein